MIETDVAENPKTENEINQPYKKNSITKSLSSTILLMLIIFSIFMPELLGSVVLVSIILYWALQLVNKKIKFYLFVLYILIVGFLVFHILIWFFHESRTISPELKLVPILVAYMILAILNLYDCNERFSNYLFLSMTVFTIIGVVSSLLNNTSIFRFPDFLPVKYGMISIYYGAIAVIGFGFEESRIRKVFYYLFALLSGSGTALLGVSVLLLLLLRRSNVSAKIYVLFTMPIAIILLLFSQAERDRDLTSLESVDRYVIQSSYVRWAKDNFGIKEVLFGCGLSCEMNSFLEYVEVPIFRGYLQSESDGTLSGRNLHSDHLRIINHFGLIGWLSVFVALYQIFKGRRDIFWSLVPMCIFNSIVTTTPVAIVILMYFKAYK